MSKHQKNWIESRQLLRNEAEYLATKLTSEETAAQPAGLLMHELLVHKIELELQVEELRSAQTAGEETLGRYRDLYDHAPFGYLTLDRDGLISDINLSGCALLGVERSKLLGCNFTSFIALHERGRWDRFDLSIMGHTATGNQVLALEILADDGTAFPAQLHCKRPESGDPKSALRVALIDVRGINQAIVP